MPEQKQFSSHLRVPAFVLARKNVVYVPDFYKGKSKQVQRSIVPDEHQSPTEHQTEHEPPSQPSATVIGKESFQFPTKPSKEVNDSGVNNAERDHRESIKVGETGPVVSPLNESFGIKAHASYVEA